MHAAARMAVYFRYSSHLLLNSSFFLYLLHSVEFPHELNSIKLASFTRNLPTLSFESINYNIMAICMRRWENFVESTNDRSNIIAYKHAQISLETHSLIIPTVLLIFSFDDSQIEPPFLFFKKTGFPSLVNQESKLDRVLFLRAKTLSRNGRSRSLKIANTERRREREREREGWDKHVETPRTFSCRVQLAWCIISTYYSSGCL